ncbi:sulfur carrier protein ThiS [Bowmanella dokdonensis]|uniref:Sulfur carrier protein ThiS n=1 Tax=Bowmanella dokdonensis TaxID=751969 RepID=A0A939DQX7_9ALTE|nr:sulfur carrier protein ThiS [Bowmanella dokdonensis]MBN7826296.1 sulfur carrier protein ThiS [Bowmanella dokdonensis]
MQLMINNETAQFPAPLSLQQLLELLEQPEKGIALALNRQVISRSLWPQIFLQEGDSVHLFNVVAGG